LITVLCANAGIDKTYEISNFAAGGYYHPGQVQTVAGGKGINVARVLRARGQPLLVTGFAGGNNGRFLTRQLMNSGISMDFVPVAEESRVCINIIDGAQGTGTRVDEVGPLVTPNEIDRLTRKWERLLEDSRLAIISGSAPRGAPYELYAELVAAARDRRVPVIVDARDEMLARAVAARPTMIKPNLSEFQRLMERPLPVPDGLVEAGRELLLDRLKVLVVSMGVRGAIGMSEQNGFWWARPPKVNVVSSVGSGDALVAGFAAAWMERAPFEERLRLATAAAAANAATFGAGVCTRERIDGLLPEVKLERLDADREAEAAQPDQQQS
jgi:1-phosphofructokinase family hexose kinase